jgi:hypothetical protein
VHYVIYQWHSDGAKNLVIDREFSTHEAAQNHFVKRLPRLLKEEHITFPIEARSAEEAIALAGTGNHWAVP